MKKNSFPNFDQTLFAVVYPDAYSVPKERLANKTPAGSVPLTGGELIRRVVLLNIAALKNQTVIPHDSLEFQALQRALEVSEQGRFERIAAIWIDGAVGFIRCSAEMKPERNDLINGYYEAYRRSMRFPKHYQRALVEGYSYSTGKQ